MVYAAKNFRENFTKEIMEVLVKSYGNDHNHLEVATKIVNKIMGDESIRC